MINPRALFGLIVGFTLLSTCLLEPALGNGALPLADTTIQNRESLTFENTGQATYTGYVRSSSHIRAIEEHIARQTPKDKVFSLAYCKCNLRLGKYAVAYVKRDNKPSRAIEACLQAAASEGGCLSKPEVVAITSEGVAKERASRHNDGSRLKSVKRNIPYLFERATLYQQRYDFSSALIHIERILEIDPDNYVAALRGGWLSHKLRSYEKAISLYRKANKLKPDSLEARIGVLAPLTAAKRWKDVKTIAGEVIRIAPKNHSALVARSNALKALGEKEEALKLSEEIIAAYPIDQELARVRNPLVAHHFKKSIQYERQGRLGAALDEVLKAVQLDSSNYAGNLRAGWLHYQLQDYYSSIRSYTRAVKQAPKALEPIEGLLLPLIAQKQWADVVPLAEKALKVAPNNYTAASCLAYANFSLGKYGAAGRLYKEMIRLYPSQTDMQLGWGWTLYRLGRTDAAHKWFMEVLKVKPGDRKAIEGIHTVVAGL